MSDRHESKYVPAAGFRWLTPLYDVVVAATTRERTFKQALIRQAGIEPGHWILDLGCGTGTLSVWMKQQCPGARISGMDGDPSILSLAVRKAQRAGVSIEFDEALSNDLPYPDACFDRIVSSLFFHHLVWEDKQRTAKEIVRTLKPGGELHVADWGPAANILMRGLFLPIQLLDGFSNTRDNLSGRLVELFEQAGLADVSQRRSFATVFGTMRLYSAVKRA